MKTKILTVVVIFLSSITLLAQDQYTKGMTKALSFWEEGKIVEASNLFERIAMAEEDNWIPYYYVAQVNTTASFGEKDETKLRQQLDRAKEFVDIAKKISPDNPELIVQEAMINTAWMAFDGATYGPTLAGKNTQLYAKALQMAPSNPRVVYSKASWDMGSARYFGKDTAPYCKDVERALKLFATFENDTPFYPSWGEDSAKKELEQCKG
ncbi:MAG: hypothetical protein ACFB0A_10775 [Croceivirga sp.]